MNNIDKLLKFTKFLNKFREVERVIYRNNKNEWENDAEHSYQLTMLAWYLIDTHKLDLDLDKVLKYCLAHDLVETYAGDTFIYDDVSDKEKREHDALQKIKQEFTEFPNLILHIEQYEKKDDPESRFVYALDKIEPMLAIYLDKGRIWKDKKITIDMILKNKTPKVALDPTIKKYFEEIVEILKKEPQLFT